MDLESILKTIYPEKNQKDCLSGVVSTMGHILQNGSSFLKVKKVTPGGSLARNTILKGHLEVDCVYILERNGFSYYHNYREVVNALQKNLPKNVQYEMKKHLIHFYLEYRIGTIAIDLLPAFEVNSLEQIAAVKNKEAYYGSTALFQKIYFTNVVKNYSRYADLVLLLKLWKKNHQSFYLTSYMIELIASNAIKDTQQGESFEFYFEVCFRTIQSFIDGRKILPVFWEKYVDNSKLKFSHSRNNLWMIDPSDPKENIAEKINEKDKALIKHEATKGITGIHNGDYSFLFK
jgi:tRNA nucleotidyltransferase (CCA-adding enzyme)